MKLKDIKVLYGVALIVFGIIVYIGGYVMLPKKVEALEARCEVNGDAVGKLATTVEQYIAVNQERVKGQEIREQMMFELIKEIRQERANYGSSRTD